MADRPPPKPAGHQASSAPRTQPPKQPMDVLTPGVGSFLIGGIGCALGVIGWSDKMKLIRFIDLPLTMALFLVCAYITLAARSRRGDVALIGLALSAVGCLSAILALILDREHPWMS